MPRLLERLKSLKEEIRVAIIGIGSIGKGLVHQASITPGIRPVAIADIQRDRAENCAIWLGLDYVLVNTLDELESAIEQGKVAVTDSGELLGSTELVDVCIEASCALGEAARHGIAALSHGQHLVMMNFEADLMFGPYLFRLARQNGLVYTSADGDQPTAIKKLVDDMELWGFELVVAGNIKGYLDRYTTPASIATEADKRSLDHKMCSSYSDGTKLCVEMAVLANALGMKAATPGMHGPRVKNVLEIFDALDIQALWEEHGPFVDYVLGAEPKGGVFAIGHTEDAFHQYTLDWYPPDMGPGPFYIFYRPYHLGAIEAMNCVAEAWLDGTARLQPRHGMRSNVFAYAKRDLSPGDRVDGMGGYAAYGLIENIPHNGDRPGLPICIADNLRLKRPIPRDAKIYLEDVEYDPASLDFDLYHQALHVQAIAPIHPEPTRRQYASIP